MFKVLRNTVSPKAINIQDVDLVFTVNAYHNNGSIICFFIQTKGKVNSRKDVKFITTEVPVSVLLAHKLTFVVLELVSRDWNVIRV